ncbi:uncharacterized protein LOC111338958 [Stylophora pistillata]|uniref:Uncharacterized protein n=1 Tax=Stylophora pistillata TaxID=50429 RepID=A0A2B4RPV8_STYPI|nr:uncharacterized protein LOC111338958 [Stylophora pistillata]XP_022801262.1 uncharacterized protein LOC111338958 [Stylophora pistillata]PFX18843.1 hypothetical protein AWC38_SpisGene25869 [Stylophora pistillata]
MPSGLQGVEQNDGDTAELCIERLLTKLSEVEIVLAAHEGRANQMKKERDAANAANERLQKEITKLTNNLLRNRWSSAVQNIGIIEEQENGDGNFEGEDENYDLALNRRRRGSLPVASMRRRGSLDHPKDLRKLLDQRSNEVLQQRQQYRIFANRFKQEVRRCSRLEQDTERLKQLLVDLLSIHNRFHRSYVFPCNNVTAVVIIVLIALTMIGIIVFNITEIRFSRGYVR